MDTKDTIDNNCCDYHLHHRVQQIPGPLRLDVELRVLPVVVQLLPTPSVCLVAEQDPSEINLRVLAQAQALELEPVHVVVGVLRVSVHAYARVRVLRALPACVCCGHVYACMCMCLDAR